MFKIVEEMKKVDLGKKLSHKEVLENYGGVLSIVEIYLNALEYELTETKQKVLVLETCIFKEGFYRQFNNLDVVYAPNNDGDKLFIGTVSSSSYLLSGNIITEEEEKLEYFNNLSTDNLAEKSKPQTTTPKPVTEDLQTTYVKEQPTIHTTKSGYYCLKCGESLEMVTNTGLENEYQATYICTNKMCYQGYLIPRKLDNNCLFENIVLVNK